MDNKKIKINFKTDMQMDRSINVKEFFELHEFFMKGKILEGLSTRTLQEYFVNLHYFNKWMQYEYQSDYDCVVVDIDLF